MSTPNEPIELDHIQAIRELTKERDEAREWVAKLQRKNQTLTCVYCGKEYPPGSPTHGAPVLTEHIRVCDKHPMREVEAQRDRLHSALAGVIGASSRAELEGMESVIRSTPAPAEDKAVALDAIHALLCIQIK